MKALTHIPNLFLESIKTLKLLPKERVIIAVSGGLDSIALAYLFAETQSIHQLQLEVAHMTHNIRSTEEGHQDYIIVEKIAENYHLPLHHYVLSKKENNLQHGKEQHLRTIRQQWLKSLCHDETDRVALAHHQNDQVETIFMRLNQYYPLKGLMGIPKENHPFIRPLMFIQKKELQKFLLEHHFTWAEDSTNTDLSILRNQIRSMVQEIEPYWPGMEASLLHLGHIASENQELIDFLLTQALKQSYHAIDHFRYPYLHFKQQHRIIQRELIYYWFNELMKGKIRPDYRLPQKFVNSINMNPNGSILLRGHGFEIRRIKKELIIQRLITKEQS
ncbi:tRNA lysidine(34) synthetase TilS [Entomospira entomophila]|uniref:tRNA(Ile)-lysidine synthase n=1 Tax=Entomospira entomophila TaxID=2719988 RepID=A0A968GAK4_9SPIO|nr:tRNA lysidine(34) synthetase TilS [Entomospira entomophilus]NIZ40840.1 tRNA lysidine(34) synthetase TilS [Entomospira entomophilus]WDI35052.1 tRNA lysidine(34) synthetase TilS [Entomospira entomophilus]